MALPRYNITIEPQNDGEEDILGISQIAYTSNPAIVTKGVYFNEIKKEMSFTDTLKLRVAAPAIIPDLPIYRKDDEMGEYEVVFTKEVIEKLRENFMKNKGKEIFNLDHKQELQADSFILDSWITGPSESDPSYTKYGVSVPEGTWFVVSQFTDAEYFQKEIIEKDRIGYSIEGMLNLAFNELIKEEFESYNDYPQAASDNAQIALNWAEKNGWGDCGTPVGKARANQLANKESLSRETIARMAAFERQRQNSNRELGDGCGRLMWLAWGGDEGVEWAQRKLKQIDKEKLEVYIIEPKANESEEEFVARCIPEEINNGMDQDQAVAVCYNKYKEKNTKMEKQKFAKATLEDGTVIYVSAMEVGGEVMVIDENGDKTPVFDGEHLLTDGSTVVTVDGKITEIKPKAEEMAEEVVEVAPVVAEVTPMDEAAIMAIVQPKLDELLAVIAELKTKIEEVPEVEVELKKEEFKSKEIPSLSRLFTSIKK
jgi:hypothetical protein